MKSPATEKSPSEIWSAARTIIKLQRQAPPIKPFPRDSNLPLSFAQARLWFLHQLQPDSLSYQSLRAYRLTGSLNVTALEQSLNQIQQRHEALRTNFPTVEGHPVQLIAPTATLKLPIVDIRKLPETEREAEAQRQAIQEAQQPFDLAKGPLWRVKLLHLTTEEHVLLLSMHHIVYDGWSLGVLFRELAALYQAFSTNQFSLGHATLTPLPELPIQYADFAVWQRQWLSGKVLESQLNYWKQQLSGTLPVLQLPTDYPRPPVQTYRGTSQSLVLPLDLTAALKSLSQQSGVTLFMTLLAAFQTLLYRYTEQEDIIVGSPIANRNRREIEGLIGFFANTLVLRTDLSGNPTFRELLRRVSQVASGAYGHQDLPFEKLVEELQPERDLSRTPLFQVMFILLNTPTSPLELPGLAINSVNVPSGTTKFDLTLYVEDTAQGLRGSLSYNTDLFDTATISRMLGHFQTLLEGIVANPEQRLEDLPLLTAAEQHQLLVEWNNTQTDYPNNICIHQLFEAQVERTPNAIAVVFENEQLTYQQLNHRANQLAHHLQKWGVKPEVTVGICLERSLEMLVALLAILKAGGAYIPLDPTYPQERLAFMLEDSLLSLLLTTSKIIQNSLYASEKVSTNRIDSNEQSSNPEQLTVICLDKTWETINQENPENPESNVNPTNLAYILYTSGSTGFPKGVTIEHRSTVNFINWAQTVFNPGQLAGVLASTSICFDLSVFELFVPLSCGGKVILAENALHLPTLKAAKDVTLINTVPSAIAELLRANALPQNVQTVNLAGEPLSQQLVNQLYQQTTLQQVFNLYGPSEATTYSTFTLCVPRRGENEKVYPSPSIGRPIANTQIYILNSHLQPVPIGVPGELYIGGDGLARSYLNRQNLTEEKFIPNSFLNSKFKIQKLKGDRLYKTGDLARYLPNGNIEFLGRIDNQVKIRGFRIELGEVESTLSQYPTVQQCVVTARVDCGSDKHLVAYIVSNQQQKPTTDELRCFLKQKLPDYMVPSAFIFLDTLPLTPNGKIDQRALPAPDGLRQEPVSTFVSPSDDLEIQLTKIWENVLGKKPISVKDNFFDVGGHSLLAVRLLAQIEKAFGKNFPLATLFQSPTIEQLANILRQKGWSAPCESLVVIQPGGAKRPLFFLHVLGEGLKYCRSLTSHLEPEQPIYGLAVGIMDEVSFNKVKDVVAHYIKEMRSIQPEGPYLLVGIYCGGRVAYEVAQQLHAQGQKVALLALLDTLKDDKAIKIMPVEERVLAHWNNFLRIGPAYFLSKRRLGEAKNRLMSIYCEFYERLGLPLPQACQSFTYRKKKEEGNTEWEFAPKQVYPERVTLFRPMENIDFLDPDFGWSELAPGGLEIHDVPGNTLNMLEEPHVQVVGEKLRDCINRVQAEDLYHVRSINHY